MSESNKLEQILELLLAEENEKAEELLHEYVVDKARTQYEKVLDEAEEVEVDESEESEEEAVEESEESDEEAVEESAEELEVEETIDQTNDFEDDIMRDNDEIEADESGLEEDDEEEMDSVEGEEDLEDKVDDLEAELEDLRAEFEKLLADDGEEEDDAEELDAPEMDMDGEEEFESVEYDIEESVEDEVVEEATKFSDTVAEPKGGEADSNESPFTKAPKSTKVAGAGAPVKAKDGGEGNKGESAKDHTPTDNIKVEPKKA